MRNWNWSLKEEDEDGAADFVLDLDAMPDLEDAVEELQARKGIIEKKNMQISIEQQS